MNFLLSMTTVRGFLSLEVEILQILQKGVQPTGDADIFLLNKMLSLSPVYFGLFRSVNHQANKRVSVLVRLIDPDHC